MSTDSWRIPDPRTQPDFYADLPLKRLIAWIVDTAIVALICLALVPLSAFAAVFFLPALMLAVGFVYRVLTLARHSATWGMRLMAIEFRTLPGARFDLPMALAHTFGFTLSCLVLPLQLLSIALMLSTPRGQGLSDHLLGTVAINRPAAA
ncbi:MAG: RDD family protein [Roseovarius sp.]